MKMKPEYLMTLVLVLCMGFTMYANLIHNDSMVQMALNLTGQAFASITTLVVKGAMDNHSQSDSNPILKEKQ